MNKEQLIAIIQGGHTTDGDLAEALLAELAKVQEPFGYYENGRWSIVTDGGPDKWRARKEYTGPLYTHPIPQPDLVAYPAPSVPEGYQLVPIEPTVDQIVAGQDAASIENSKRIVRIYKAMLSAARSE